MTPRRVTIDGIEHIVSADGRLVIACPRGCEQVSIDAQAFDANPTAMRDLLVCTMCGGDMRPPTKS